MIQQQIWSISTVAFLFYLKKRKNKRSHTLHMYIIKFCFFIFFTILLKKQKKCLCVCVFVHPFSFCFTYIHAYISVDRLQDYEKKTKNINRFVFFFLLFVFLFVWSSFFRYCSFTIDKLRPSLFFFLPIQFFTLRFIFFPRLPVCITAVVYWYTHNIHIHINTSKHEDICLLCKGEIDNW
jgi:hypothetical protein